MRLVGRSLVPNTPDKLLHVPLDHKSQLHKSTSVLPDSSDRVVQVRRVPT